MLPSGKPESRRGRRLLSHGASAVQRRPRPLAGRLLHPRALGPPRQGLGEDIGMFCLLLNKNVMNSRSIESIKDFISD